MTTTSQQPPAGDPSRGSGAGDPGAEDRGEAARPARRGSLVRAGVVLAVVVLVAVLGWLFTMGPMSSAGRVEREVAQTLDDMSAAESFAEFNSHMCAENRVPQELVDQITASGEQTGTDLDSMLRESIAGSFPADLQVTGVEVDGNGTEASATVESGGEDGETTNEQIQMRNEDGAWKLCEPGVGMGAVPQEGQPG